MKLEWQPSSSKSLELVFDKLHKSGSEGEDEQSVF